MLSKLVMLCMQSVPGKRIYCNSVGILVNLKVFLSETNVNLNIFNCIIISY